MCIRDRHTGTNMLALTRHFANTDLSNTQSHNASFFNFLGFLIVYPSSLDLVILIAALPFIAFLLFRSFRKNTIGPKSFGLSFLLILISVVLTAGLSFGLGKLLLSTYPQYEVFMQDSFITTSGISSLVLASAYLLHPCWSADEYLDLIPPVSKPPCSFSSA